MYCNPGSIIKDMQLRIAIYISIACHNHSAPFLREGCELQGFGEAGLHKHITKQPGLSLQDGASRKSRNFYVTVIFMKTTVTPYELKQPVIRQSFWFREIIQ